MPHKDSPLVIDSEWYLTSYTDVAASGMSPLLHYQKFGKAEGRLPCANAAYDLELCLWQGDESALSSLKGLKSANATGYEVAYAQWALARWYASAGEWQTARLYIDAILSDSSTFGLPQNQGPTLLAFTILCMCKEFDEAGLVIKRSTLLAVNTSDYSLALCSLNQCRGGAFISGISALSKMYTLNNVLPLKIEGSVASLDNLITDGEFNFVTGDLVSVVVPVFNSETTLNAAIQSLQAQTWGNLEIIIIDDASEDDSFIIATQLADNDSRIKVHKQHVNQGAYIARNTGLNLAKGDFITVHDADDYSHCQKIQLQVEALTKNQTVKASVSHWARCSSDLVFGAWRQDVSWVHRNVSSLMFRRDVFKALGFWDSVSINADTEYYYRILKAFGEHSIVEVKPGVPLAFGRTGENNLTQNSITHLRTQFLGVRKDYMDAAQTWHKSVNKGDLYIAYNPLKRRFNAPSVIQRKACFIGESGIPFYPGAQALDTNQESILLCAHMAGDTLYGAERSFIDMAKAICIGNSHEASKGLVIVLPQHSSTLYRNELRKYCSALVIVPFTWWRGAQLDSPIIISQLETVIQAFNIKLVSVNTLVVSAPHIAAKRQGVPSLMHVRELPDFDPNLCSLLQAKPKVIKEKMLQLATGYIANSECTSAYVASPNNCDVLYNTVNADDFDLPLPVHDDGVVTFALISSNTPKKGVAMFLKLATLASKQVPLARFLLIGPITDYVNTLKNTLPSNLTLCGYAPSPQQALVNADVVLNLSEFQESFGRTVAEAMAAARPVIAYRWGAVAELVDNGINGYLVHYSDIQGLLLRVQKLTEDNSLRHEFGTLARQNMLAHFNFEEYTKQLNKIYRNYLNVSGRYNKEGQLK